MNPADLQRSLTVLLVAAAAAALADPATSPPRDERDPTRAAIRLDARQRQVIGLTYGLVERRPMEKVIRTVGRFDFDERKISAVTLKVGGYIQDLFVDYTGKAVRKGDRLLSIYSPDLVSAEREYLLAVETRRALDRSRVPGAIASADALVRASRERLRLWDIGGRQIRELEEDGKPRLSLTMHSPASGVVIEKTAFAGQAVEPGMTLYKIADLSTIWVYGDIYEYELPFVRVGEEAKITLAYLPGRTFTARVAYVYPTLDAKTRTVRVRFELPNTADLALKPEMYANVELHISAGERLVVPRSAVLDSGRRQIVFVDAGGGRIDPRAVELGDRFDHDVEVKSGLREGERVVTSGNFLIDSESQLQGAESMMGMMGSIGMGDWKMESAKPMQMGGEDAAPGTEPHGRAAAEGPETKRVGDLSVAVLPSNAKVGENAVQIRLRDANGEPVAGATVRFGYTMDMPGMTIEQSATKDLGGGLYEGKASFSMPGPWGVVVEIDRPGKPPLREKFVVRVAGGR